MPLGDLVTRSRVLLECSFPPTCDQAAALVERKRLTYSSSSRWSLPNPEYYTLRYADGPQLYITEQVSLRDSNVLVPQARVEDALS